MNEFENGPMFRIDALVADLELEGYPTEMIMDELHEYLELCDELQRV